MRVVSFTVFWYGGKEAPVFETVNLEEEELKELLNMLEEMGLELSDVSVSPCG